MGAGFRALLRRVPHETAPAWMIRAPVRIKVGISLTRTFVANHRLRRSGRLRCGFRAAAAGLAASRRGPDAPPLDRRGPIRYVKCGGHRWGRGLGAPPRGATAMGARTGPQFARKRLPVDTSFPPLSTNWSASAAQRLRRDLAAARQLSNARRRSWPSGGPIAHPALCAGSPRLPPVGSPRGARRSVGASGPRRLGHGRKTAPSALAPQAQAPAVPFRTRT